MIRSMSRADATTLTIGQLARAAGVPTTTVRYYERTGLLKPEARTGGNYRAYSQAALVRLRFIRTAQSAGLSLDDVATLIGLKDEREPPCAEVQAILRERLADLERRLDELRSIKSTLESALHACSCAPRGGLCEDIARLGKKSAKSA